jgi:cytochrome P450
MRAGVHERSGELLSNLVLLLNMQPEILERVRREPGIRLAAVEEVLRYISPVIGVFRHTTKEVEVADTALPANAKVLLMYGSANHDERHYDRPDELVIDRSRAGSLTPTTSAPRPVSMSASARIWPGWSSTCSSSGWPTGSMPSR